MIPEDILFKIQNLKGKIMSTKIKTITCEYCKCSKCEFKLYVGDFGAIFVNKNGEVTFSYEEKVTTKGQLKETIKEIGINNVEVFLECPKCEDETSGTIIFDDGIEMKGYGLDVLAAFKKAFKDILF